MTPRQILLVRTIQMGQPELSLKGVQPTSIDNQERLVTNLNAMPYTCPVCGYPKLEEPPRSTAGGGSYEICPSCGFEFGVTDDDRGHSDESWRHKWIRAGMPWDWGRSKPPNDWDPVRQLKNIGVDVDHLSP